MKHNIEHNIAEAKVSMQKDTNGASVMCNMTTMFYWNKIGGHI
jgi:hypothetical protein